MAEVTAIIVFSYAFVLSYCNQLQRFFAHGVVYLDTTIDTATSRKQMVVVCPAYPHLPIVAGIEDAKMTGFANKCPLVGVFIGAT